MRFLAIFIPLFFPAALLAESADECIKRNVSISATNIAKEIDSFGFDLTIENGLSKPLGGAIVRYELWSLERPTALASGYSQFAHTLPGGLLSGEETLVREFIGMQERVFALAEAATSLKVELELENVSDLEGRPLGSSYDPFGLWSNDRSSEDCKPRSGAGNE